MIPTIATVEEIHSIPLEDLVKFIEKLKQERREQESLIWH